MGRRRGTRFQNRGSLGWHGERELVRGPRFTVRRYMEPSRLFVEIIKNPQWTGNPGPPGGPKIVRPNGTPVMPLVRSRKTQKFLIFFFEIVALVWWLKDALDQCSE